MFYYHIYPYPYQKPQGFIPLTPTESTLQTPDPWWRVRVLEGRVRVGVQLPRGNPCSSLEIDTSFANSAKSRRKLSKFWYDLGYVSRKKLALKKLVKNISIAAWNGGKDIFELRRLCKDFLTRFGGRGKKQTSYIVIRRYITYIEVCLGETRSITFSSFLRSLPLGLGWAFMIATYRG